MFVSHEQHVLSKVELDALEPFWNAVNPGMFVDDGLWYRARVHNGEVLKSEAPEFRATLYRPVVERVVVLWYHQLASAMMNGMLSYRKGSPSRLLCLLHKSGHMSAASVGMLPQLARDCMIHSGRRS